MTTKNESAHYWYETQERALAPGIADGWPLVIPAPHSKNGRLVRRSGDPGELLAVAVKVLNALYGPAECTHGNEGDEDICDGCAFTREKAVGLVASELRAAIAKAEGKA